MLSSALSHCALRVCFVRHLYSVAHSTYLQLSDSHCMDDISWLRLTTE